MSQARARVSSGADRAPNAEHPGRCRWLAVALGVAVCTVLGSTALAVAAFRSESRHQDQAVRGELAALVEAQRLIALSERRAHRARQFLLTGNPEVLPSWYAVRNDFEATIARLERLLPEQRGRAQLGQIREQQRRLSAVVEPLLELKRAGAPPELIVTRLEREAQPLRTELDHALEALVAEVRTRLQASLARAEQARLLAVTALIGVTPPGVLISIVLGLLLWRAARRREEERRSADAQVRASEARLRRLFEANIVGLIFWDIQGGIQDANDAFLASVGYTRDDLRAGRVDWRLLTPADWARQDAELVNDLVETGKHRPAEKEYLRKDGSRVPVIVAATLIPGSQREGIAFVLDISDRKRAERSLQESEARARSAAADAEAQRAMLDAVLDAAGVGIIAADASGKILRMNPANERLWGAAPFSETVEDYGRWKGWWADHSERHGRRVGPEEWAMARALRGEIARGDIVEIEPFDQPGTRRTMINSAAPVRAPSGEILGAVIAQMDISPLVTAERALRDSEERFRALADNISQLAWMADETGFIFWYNRRWLEYTGTTLDDVTGGRWQRCHHPDHLERVVEKFRRHIESGEPWEDTFPLLGQDGTYRWFLSRALPIRHASGQVVRWFGTNTDITEQREAEEALLRAVRLRDEFLTVAAHELRTPLTALGLQLESLQKLSLTPATGDPERAARKLAVAIRQSERLATLVEGLLDVARLASGRLELHLEWFDMRELILEVVERQAEVASRAQCELRVDLGEAALGSWDRSRLEQVLMNLLGNALKYGPRCPVELRLDRSDDGVTIAVRDHGIGIAEADRERVFGRFERAVPASHYGGLGLGLYIAREIVGAHGGTIELEQPDGSGALFVVRLPRVTKRGSSESLPTEPPS